MNYYKIYLCVEYKNYLKIFFDLKMNRSYILLILKRKRIDA